jgi:hypothetical protein
MNVKRLIGGLSGLILLVGVLFFLFGANGLADPLGFFWLGGAGPVTGIVLVAIGVVGLVVLWASRHGGRGSARRIIGGLSGLFLLAGALAFCFGANGPLDPNDKPLERVHAAGTPKGGQVSLMLEFRGGATALVGWAAGASPATLDLTVLGNHGALYHDAGGARLWEGAALDPPPAADKELLALLERALRSGAPEMVEGGAP